MAQDNVKTVPPDILWPKGAGGLPQILQFEVGLHQMVLRSALNGNELSRQGVTVLEPAVGNLAARQMPALRQRRKHFGSSYGAFAELVEGKWPAIRCKLRQLFDLKIFGK